MCIKSCADPESFVRGSQTFLSHFFPTLTFFVCLSFVCFLVHGGEGTQILLLAHQ